MGSALEDYAMSWMSRKIGGGGEIVVFTQSTISIRLSMDEDLPPSFVQERAPAEPLVHLLASSRQTWHARIGDGGIRG